MAGKNGIVLPIINHGHSHEITMKSLFFLAKSPFVLVKSPLNHHHSKMVARNPTKTSVVAAPEECHARRIRMGA